MGGPVLGGSAAHASGVFTVDGAGTDIWGTADQFHFLYRQVSGDVDLRARVDSLGDAHAWSKAGVMIRGGLSSGAPHVSAFVSAERGIAFQRRQAAGGLSTHTAGPSADAPRWVRLLRVGPDVTAYTSTDGSNWTVVGRDTIALRDTVYVGLAVTSHNPDLRTTARISNVAVRPVGLPGGQVSADIGAPVLRGSARYQDGAYTISAGGADIWGTADEFHFVYRPLQGDATVTARVASVTEAHVWSKAGVMIRESLDPDSRYAYALVSAAKGLAFQRRVGTAVESEHTAGAPATAPRWVRLVRTGSLFEAFQSADGETWSRIDSRIIGMAGTVYVGIAVTSRDPSTATTAVVDNLQIAEAQPPSNQPPAVGLTAPSQGASFTQGTSITVSASASDADGSVARVDFYAGAMRVGSRTGSPYSVEWASAPAGTHILTAVATDNLGAATTSAGVSIMVPEATGLPSGQTGADIGSPALGGTSSYANGTFTISAGGADIWDAADEFHFVYQPMHGDGAVTARVLSVTQAHVWSKAGVMIRESLTAGSRHAYALVSGASGYGFQRRPQANGPSEHTSGASGTAPGWVRLVRTGSVFEAFLSADGQAWTSMGTRTIQMADTVYVGLAVTSHNTEAATTAVIDNLRISVPEASQPPASTTEPPSGVAFTPGEDHDTLVKSYRLEIYPPGATPGRATPVAALGLGKPAPGSDGDIEVSVPEFFEALAPGEYIATVAAINSAGAARSTPVSFTR